MDDDPRDSIVPMWKRPRLARTPSLEAPRPEPPPRALVSAPSGRPIALARLALVAVAAVLASVTFVQDVSAEGKTLFLAEQLRKSTDYRTRTTAALSLGTTDDVAAVKPLCECLGDDKEVESVRIACAGALGKLKKAGAEACLKEHVNHKNAKVKEQVAASIKALGGGATAQLQCPTAPAKGTPKYYVGVEIGNKTNRPDSDIKPLVDKEVRCKLQTMSRFKIAPAGGTSPKDMTDVVTKEKLDGYLLQVTVDPIKYESGQVKVSMNLVIQTHTRDIKGTASRNAAIPGVTSPSKVDEDDLLKLLSEKLANDFAGAKP
jgi:hypothetical protein